MDFKKTWAEFVVTWKAVVLRPEEFFSKWNPAEEWQRVIVFNVICGLIGGVLTAVFTLFIRIDAIITYPLLVLASTFVGSIVLFVCFKLLGGKGDIGTTIKMVGYTQAVRAVYVGIPGIGFVVSFLATIYQIWLLTVGGKAVHGLDTSKAALAILLPFLVMGVVSLLGTVLAGIGWVAFMMNMGGG